MAFRLMVVRVIVVPIQQPLSGMHRHLEPRVLTNLVSSVMMGQIFLDALLYFAMVHRSWQYVNAIHEFSVNLDFHAEYIYTHVYMYMHL